MSKLPIPHIINTIKTKLGFDRAMTAPGEDIVDAVNKQSAEIVKLGNAIAYVENGNNATRTYTAEQFVLWKGTLYTVNSEGIAAETVINGHVTEVTGGGLNALKSNIDTLKSNVTQKVSYDTVYDITLGNTNNVFYADKVNRTLFVEMVFYTAENVPEGSRIGHVVNVPLLNRTHWSAVTSTGIFVRFVIDHQGLINVESSIPSGVWLSTSVICLINT